MRILASPAFANEKVNPYNALLYREIDKISPSVNEYSHKKSWLGRYDILHFHWPDGFINQPKLLKAFQRVMILTFVVASAKAKGTKLVWTVHNIVPHDAYHAKLSQYFMRWFIKQCDGLIFMSELSKNTFFEHYQPQEELQWAIIPHGHYRTSYPPAIDKGQAKKQLGLPENKKVLLSFGMIKPYKNIDVLVDVFARANPAEYLLVIAGNPDTPQMAECLEALQATSDKVRLFLKFIPDEELSVFLSAADLVILPYKAILNSGALLLALSFNKPVIAPRIGAFTALQQELGSQWIHCYDGELQPETLISASQQLLQAERPDICPLGNYDWDRLAQATLDFYRGLLRRPTH